MSDADPECAALSRLLMPGGRIWLVSEMPTDVDQRDRIERATVNLGRHGFGTEVIQHPTAPLVRVVGTTPA